MPCLHFLIPDLHFSRAETLLKSGMKTHEAGADNSPMRIRRNPFEGEPSRFQSKLLFEQ
jgi:hypothetical protein